jgi:murein DD-endopeptidase MepM/ murein hydrolase activator NlpD
VNIRFVGVACWRPFHWVSIFRLRNWQGRQQAPPTFLIVFLAFALPCDASAPRVLLSSTTVLPGETLRVEVDGVLPSQRLGASWLGKTYPFFVVGPDAQRALIGVRLDAQAGRYRLGLKGLSAAPTWVEVATRTFVVENVGFSKEKSALMKFEHKEALIIQQARRLLSRDQQWESVFSYPVDGPQIGTFGVKRLRNGKIDAGFHKGIDLQAAKGTPVLAANTGTVVLTRNFRAHGKTVLINHGQGVMTIYLHMQSIFVKVRQKVRKGEPIGKVGSTGLSTAPHVHFQVYVHGVPVDPKQWVETEF